MPATPPTSLPLSQWSGGHPGLGIRRPGHTLPQERPWNLFLLDPCPCQLKGFETNCFEGRWEQAWFEGPLRVMILVGLAVEGK